MAVLLISMVKSQAGNWGGGYITSPVLERLRKWCDIHTDMLLGKFVIREEIEGVS